jgi:epoxide hydrolase-like predicted phosphatase
MTEPHPSAKALLVDFGGVLTTPVWESFDAFCRQEGLPEGAVRRLFRENPEAISMLRELEAGRLAEADFESRFAGLLGLPSGGGLIERLFRGMLPEDRMVEAVRAMRRAGVLTGLVSNSWSTSHYEMTVLRELFDVILISGEVGLHKPQPEIYLMAAERLGLPPEACVFVDDLRENCTGAEAVGMTAILHRDPAETVERLAERFGVRAG